QKQCRIKQTLSCHALECLACPLRPARQEVFLRGKRQGIARCDECPSKVGHVIRVEVQRVRTHEKQLDIRRRSFHLSRKKQNVAVIGCLYSHCRNTFMLDGVENGRDG